MQHADIQAFVRKKIRLNGEVVRRPVMMNGKLGHFCELTHRASGP